MEWKKDGFIVSTEKYRLSVDSIYEFLTQKSYWAQTRTRETVEKSIEGSVCFGMYDDNKQIGFARVVTDFATFYWLCDVFVIDEYRGKGLGKWLVECIINHPELKSLRGMLATKDADGLYEKYGFAKVGEGSNMIMRRSI